MWSTRSAECASTRFASIKRVRGAMLVQRSTASLHDAGTAASTLPRRDALDGASAPHERTCSTLLQQLAVGEPVGEALGPAGGGAGLGLGAVAKAVAGVGEEVQL